MDKKTALEIFQHIDHTNLSPSATLEDIKKLCDEAAISMAASVCIPPTFVSEAKSYLKIHDFPNDVKVCSVVGFPCGYSMNKIDEIYSLIINGADEIDMVLNLRNIKEHRYELVFDEITEAKSVCEDKVLKVILETCLLTDSEIKKVSEVAVLAGADYIKTSTGFSTGGATIEAVKIMLKATEGSKTKVKAAGGISTLEDAKTYIDLGVDRIGSSKIIAKRFEKKEA